MVWGNIIIGTILFVSLLWYIWVGKVLHSQKAWIRADKRPSVEGAKIDTEALSRAERGWSDVQRLRPLSSPTVEYAKHAVKKIHDAKKKVKEQYKINRWLLIYSRSSIHINQTFYVDVHIGPEGQEKISLTRARDTIEWAKNERLQFEAFEEEPLVQVELKFAEGDFSANKTQEQQKLKKEDLTKFRFLLKALKAEDCILTVVISYILSVPLPDQIVERVTIDKTILSAGSPETKEHVEQATLTPASTATEVVEIKTLELPVSVKSLFGMNTRELELLQRAFVPVVTAILVGIALYTGRLESSDAIVFFITSIAGATGITIGDELLKPFPKPNLPDAPDEDRDT